MVQGNNCLMCETLRYSVEYNLYLFFQWFNANVTILAGYKGETISYRQQISQPTNLRNPFYWIIWIFRIFLTQQTDTPYLEYGLIYKRKRDVYDRSHNIPYILNNVRALKTFF